jgi:uncharacterized cupin superfamily protein
LILKGNELKYSIADTKHDELTSTQSGEKFSLSAVLSSTFGFKDVFVHHEIIPPGRRSSSPHAHTHREEMVYVLSGSPEVFLGGEVKTLAPGDFIGFRPGAENIHCVTNNTKEDIRLLVIASNPKDDAVIYGDI